MEKNINSGKKIKIKRKIYIVEEKQKQWGKKKKKIYQKKYIGEKNNTKNRH